MTNNLGICERYSRLQRPPASKKDEDVLANLAAWEKERRDLKELDPTMEEMPGRLQMQAIKCILPLSSRLRDYIDEREDELTTYEKLRNAILMLGLREKKNETGNTLRWMLDQ